MKDTSNMEHSEQSTSDQNMSSDQINAMMKDTMIQIQERKRKLVSSITSNPLISTGSVQTPTVSVQQAPTPATTNTSSSISALQARIAARIEALKMANAVGTGEPAFKKPARPPGKVILDQLTGRTVDAVSGEEIQLGGFTPELKANMRIQQNASGDQASVELTTKAGTSSSTSVSTTPSSVDTSKSLLSKPQSEAAPSHFDPRVNIKNVGRKGRRILKFNEKGKYINEANRLRMKAKLEMLQSDISNIAKRTGISSAMQLAKLAPSSLKSSQSSSKVLVESSDETGFVEWWDANIMKEDCIRYENYEIRADVVTNLIEHPIQLNPLESKEEIALPVYLTKTEMKKLRRQNRREAWKDKQDKIRLGFIQPDEAKVKLSNLMHVLGSEAVQDPTKVEAHVRKQMRKRIDQHEKMNAQRKLTVEQSREKMKKKLHEDTTYGVYVTVYCVKSLANPAKRFKVETNAKQLGMSGCIAMLANNPKDKSAIVANLPLTNVIVVEGGPKQQKKYKRLMTARIKWDEDLITDPSSSAEQIPNHCRVVWEGQTKERTFKPEGEIRSKLFQTTESARQYFEKVNNVHYWDLSHSTTVIEGETDN